MSRDCQRDGVQRRLEAAVAQLTAVDDGVRDAAGRNRCRLQQQIVIFRLYHVPSNCRRRLRKVMSLPASISLSVSGVMLAFPATPA